MKRFVVFLSVLLFPLVMSFAQESLLTPLESQGSGSQAQEPASGVNLTKEDGSIVDPSVESTEWASGCFVSYENDYTMCDFGTALYEDALRGQAMREHPEWPVWAIDLALENARDTYLHNMFFSE